MTTAPQGTATATPTQEYALVFEWTEPVMGPGFLAAVRACGRALMVHEGAEEGWWLYGVEPGGVAEGGASSKEAHLEFIVALRHFVQDVAARSGSFDGFKEAVEQFFSQVDEEDAARWEEAARHLPADTEIPDPFLASLKRGPVPQCGVRVDRLEDPASYSPELNFETDFAVAA